MEICLFKEVINVNPFTCEGAENIEMWSKVGENTSLALGMEKSISARTCKQKVNAQVSYFRSDDMKNIKKSVVDLHLFCVLCCVTCCELDLL